MPQPLSIVIPVYNEGANFPSLWATLCSQVCSEFAAFVIYDFEEDDTVPLIQQMIAEGENRIRVIKNNIRKGVVGAILTGFNQVEHGPVLVVMADLDRKSTRLNSSHDQISYAVFCLKKKKN